MSLLSRLRRRAFAHAHPPDSACAPDVPPACPLSLDRLVYRYGAQPVLDGISLEVPAGQVLALLGPSGCGKSTLLKVLAGLIQPHSGSVRLGARQFNGPQVFVPPERRDLGMVFQDYALWPHLSVADNVGFPLRMRGLEPKLRRERVEWALERVGLAGFGPRRPAQLSGGQQQRVSLARALVAAPRLLLFDEPLSNLDRELRETLCEEIAALLRQMNTTAVYVTHDAQEAGRLAHRIARLQSGRLLDIAPNPDFKVH
ncbi:ABC transporter ATP-binding protein [Alcaligenes sp. Marseille-Q7550]